MQLTGLDVFPSFAKPAFCFRKSGSVSPSPPRLPIFKKERRSTRSQLRATPLTRSSISDYSVKGCKGLQLCGWMSFRGRIPGREIRGGFSSCNRASNVTHQHRYASTLNYRTIALAAPRDFGDVLLASG